MSGAMVDNTLSTYAALGRPTVDRLRSAFKAFNTNQAPGLNCPVPEGAFFDLFPLTVLTTGTLNHLNELNPDSNFDERRFRMNVIVDTDEVGFVENDWIERSLTLGNAVRLHVAKPDTRCVMTTLAQEELPQDNDVLRTLVKHNRLEFADVGRFPCAGVYAVVEESGTLQVGDQASLI